MIHGLQVQATGHLGAAGHFGSRPEAWGWIGTLNGCALAENETFPDSTPDASQGSEERLPPPAEAPQPRPRVKLLD